MPINDGIRYDIAADNAEFLRAVDEARRANAKAAQEMTRDYEQMSERAGGAIATMFARFTPQGRAISAITASITAMQSAVQSTRERFNGLGERINAAAEASGRFGEQWEERSNTLKLAWEEMSAAMGVGFWGAVQNAADTPLGRALQWAVEKATEFSTALARMTTGWAESGLPIGQQSDTALRAQLDSIWEHVRALQRLRDEAQRGNPLARIFGTPEELGDRLEARLEELRAIDRELARRREAGETVGHLGSAEIESQIDAMRKRTVELRIQAETFGMAAGAAARYAAELRAIESAGGEGAFGRLSADLRRRLTEAGQELDRERQRVTDLERDKRQREQGERIGTNMEREVARLEGQFRRVAMPAGEAAEQTAIERFQLMFQQHRLTPTDAQNAKIAEAARQVRDLTEATAALKRQMDIIQSFAQTFSSSLERAFTSWMDGAWKGWQDFFHNLSKQLATLALRTAILQPLFGGGGVQQGGIFGRAIMSLLGTGSGGWQTSVIPARAGGGDVSAGQPYMVGERGRELFVPSRSGTVIPNSALRGGGNATLNMRIDVSGALGREEMAQIARTYAAIGARQAFATVQSGMPGWQRTNRLLGA